ncbi:MAG: hypothetical protein M9908_06625 [Phyllobacteriaceae bacterium]|nr:hypothetical protein [Phyllobacteriaceae bacterium]
MKARAASAASRGKGQDRRTAGSAAAENANVLVLDAGDQFQGSPFYTTYKRDAAVEFLNMIKPDAMA